MEQLNLDLSGVMVVDSHQQAVKKAFRWKWRSEQPEETLRRKLDAIKSNPDNWYRIKCVECGNVKKQLKAILKLNGGVRYKICVGCEVSMYWDRFGHINFSDLWRNNRKRWRRITRAMLKDGTVEIIKFEDGK